MIRRKRADTFVYRLYCDNCEEAPEMNAEGAYTVNPPVYRHVCPNCGHVEEKRGKRYPLIDYVEIEEQYGESTTQQ